MTDQTSKSNLTQSQASRLQPIESIKIGINAPYSWRRIDERWASHIEGYNSIEDIDLQTKEVYGLYGLSTYMACVFEASLKNMILYTEAIRGKISNMDRAHKAVGKLTMGQLLRRMNQSVKTDSHSEKLMRVALRKRNFLVHGFWELRSGYMFSDEGKKILVLELVRACQLFEIASFVMEPAIQFYLNEIAKARGMSFEELQGELDSMFEGTKK